MNAQAPRSSLIAQQNAVNLAGGNKAGKSAGDSLGINKSRTSGFVVRRDYVTSARGEAIRGQLNGHQRAILCDVGRLRVLTGKQLQRLHYGDSAAAGRLARKQIGQLIQWRVLARLGRVRRDGKPGTAGFAYGPGIVGQRLLEPGRSRYFPRWTPRPGYLRHGVAVSELYVSLREAERAGGFDLVAYDAEPSCWRRYFGPGGARSILKPDALVVAGLGDFEHRYFVEMDCSTEHRPQIIAKGKAYVRYWQSGREQAETSVFPYVLWVAPDSQRAELLVDALSSLPAEHWQLFMVSTAEEAPQRIATGTGQPISNQKEMT